MSWFNRLPIRLRSLFRRAGFESDMDQELLFRLESMIESNIRAGMSADDARREALIAFGGLDKTKEECRETRWTRYLDRSWGDLRYGARVLAKNRGLTIVALIALSLGIGANTAMFSVVEAILLRPLPYDTPDQLVVFTDESGDLDTISPPYFRGLRERNHAFQALAMFESARKDLTEAGQPDIVKAGHVSAGLFGVLRVKPICGRGFTEEEDRPASPRVVVLGNGLWQGRFGSDPNILGRTLRLNGKPYTVIGVMPTGFSFPDRDTGLWTTFNVENPEAYDHPEDRGAGVHTIARMRSGVVPALAEEDVNQNLAKISDIYPQYRHDTHVWVTRLHPFLVGDVRPALLMLLGAVNLVLLVACTNVATLMLIRAEERRKEIAVRLALGAARGDLIRLLAIESLLLSIIGCGIGLLIARIVLVAMIKLAPATIPRLDETALNVPVLLFAFVISMFTTLVSGVFPALKCSRPSLSDALKEGWSKSSVGTGRSWVRNALVVCQLTVAVVLLVGAGLMAKTFIHLFQLRLGFDPRSVLTLRLELPWRENAYANRYQRLSFLKQACDRLESIPGVESVALVIALPLSSSSGSMSFRDGQKSSQPDESYWADFRIISAKYFQTMRIPVLRGRTFGDSDGAQSSPAIIINQSMAKKFWPTLDNPVGKQLWRGNRPCTVVGVVADVRSRSLGRQRDDVSAMTLQAYLPLTADHLVDTYVIRTRLSPLTMVGAIRKEIWTLDKNQPTSEVATMEQRVADFTSVPRFYSVLLASFAVISVLLGSVGLYGVISYSVTTRTHEIGVRIAVGAGRQNILRMMLRDGIVLACSGLVLGLALGGLLRHLLVKLVFELQPNDPAAFISVALIFVIVAVVASLVPAYAASRVDPLASLRCE